MIIHPPLIFGLQTLPLKNHPGLPFTSTKKILSILKFQNGQAFGVGLSFG